MIPKRIITIWLNDNPVMPELIGRCIATHKLEGYDHHLITLENYEHIPYVDECIKHKKWAKAADYLRAWYLYQEGGIYLDADCEVLKPFDDLLDAPMFVGEEENGFVSNAIIGSVSGHPILEDFLTKVASNFIPSGDLVFQAGMFLWTEIIKYSAEVKIYPPEYFLPFNHHNGTLKVTDKSYTIHHFAKSWK